MSPRTFTPTLTSMSNQQIEGLFDRIKNNIFFNIVDFELIIGRRLMKSMRFERKTEPPS